MQFLIAGGLLMLVAMVAAGFLITNLVSRDHIRNKAASTALFMESLVGPIAQELASSPSLSPQAIANLNELFSADTFRSQFPYFEIWTPDSVVAYSNSSQIIGQRFPPPAGLLPALSGEVTAIHADPSAREHVVRGIATRYLEIYSPIRQDGSSRIIAVAEIHELTEPFQQDLAVLKSRSWAVVAAVTLAIMLGLFGIVHRGSRMIDAQSAALKRRIREVELVSQQNRLLKERSERASARVAELNEQFIRNIGADLHDGPAQLISFSLLKVDEIGRATAKASRDKSLKLMHSALDEAMREIRSIAKGLLLPDITDLPLSSVIERAVRAHEARTHTQVALSTAEMSGPLSQAVRICVFRFVQEGLNNAWRHGGGVGQEVRSSLEASTLHVSVSDRGTDSAKLDEAASSGRLGLYGLRERVESLGGTLTIKGQPEGGSLIQMSLDLSGGLLDA